MAAIPCGVAAFFYEGALPMSKPTVGGHSSRCRIVIDTCADLSPEIAATLDVDILGFP